MRAGEAYGRSDTLAGQKLNLEFVSANPTGPVHIGAVRWAAVGDALARLLQACGAQITREYYFNDAGSQIERFARTLREVANGGAVPEDGYAGSYVDEIAQQVLDRNPGVLNLPDEEQTEIFQRDGVELMFAEIKSSLAEFGVIFDVYFNERDLHESDELNAALKRLRDQGNIYEADGATWLRSTAFGDDRDRVLVREQWRTDVLRGRLRLLPRQARTRLRQGRDHARCRSPRLRQPAAGDGDLLRRRPRRDARDSHRPAGQLGQGRRAGADEQAGRDAGARCPTSSRRSASDAARYALARYSTDSEHRPRPRPLGAADERQPRLLRAVRARAPRLAAAQRRRTRHRARAGSDLGLLDHDRETDLLGALGEFPRVVASAAELRAPHRVAHYLEVLAGTYHRFYDVCRVLPLGDEPATAAHRTPGCGCARPPGSCSRTASACSACTPPERM